MAPKISVYITSYNQKDYLVEAIESVLGQTLPPHQIIVVDDCSADGSQEVIAGYASRYPELITAIYHPDNRGIAATRKDALEAVIGDFATFVDGDDRFLPEKLAIEAQALEKNPNARIAFSDYYYISPDGNRIGLWAGGATPPEGDIFCEIFGRDFPQRTLYRSELVDYRAWKQIGFHDPVFTTYEDYEMRIRLTKTLRAVYTGEPASEYRVGISGLSRARAAEHLANLEKIMKKNRPLLDDLPPERREYVIRSLHEVLHPLAASAMRQMQGAADRFGALRYYLKTVTYGGTTFGVKAVADLLWGRPIDLGGNFGGWDRESGLRPEEGPYVKWDLPVVRWGLGPKTELHFSGRGKRMTLRAMCGAHHLPRQRITIRLNGEPVHRQEFHRVDEFREMALPLDTRAGRNLLAIEYETWDTTDERVPLALLFKKLRIDTD